jgi:predicted GNAT family acetyltransferase
MSDEVTIIRSEEGSKGRYEALVERLIADARGEDFTIVPLCPFVRSQYQRHPEWSDVMGA